MSLPCWLFPLRARFLRTSRTFSDGLKTHAPGQFNQDGSQVCLTHSIKHVPLGLGDRDHHTMISRRNFVGNIVSRTLKVRGEIISQVNRYLGGFCSSQRIFPPQIIPTVCLDVTSLVACSYGYDNGKNGPTRC